MKVKGMEKECPGDQVKMTTGTYLVQNVQWGIGEKWRLKQKEINKHWNKTDVSLMRCTASKSEDENINISDLQGVSYSEVNRIWFWQLVEQRAEGKGEIIEKDERELDMQQFTTVIMIII